MGGGGVYSYIHVLPNKFLFKSNSNCQFEFDLKRNSSVKNFGVLVFK